MGFLQNWRAFRAFANIPRAKRNIVFYSEGPAYWAHLRPVIKHLTHDHNRRIIYVTSDPQDPGYTEENAKIQGYAIGSGLIRAMWFQMLDAEMLVMTMPDLGARGIKKSKFPIHYTYLFHSIVSTHMIYRTGAFDHYDSILCVGPHHKTEIRETEKKYGLPQKELVPHGYGRLDEILAERPRKTDTLSTPEQPLILIAPSWGPNGVIETGLVEPLIDALLTTKYQVMLRPHPETLKRAKNRYAATVKRFSPHPNFMSEQDVDSKTSLQNAALMVSDWSGAAFEFAFGYEKPVLFIDSPRKLNNPEFDTYSTPPIEDFLRSQIGTLLAPTDISEINHVVTELIETSNAKTAQIRQLRKHYVHHVGKSGQIAAKWIAERSESLKPK